MDIDLLEIIARNLRTLSTSWDQDIDMDYLHNTSHILRRLLIADGKSVLADAWREVGFVDEPKIPAFSIYSFTEGYPTELWSSELLDRLVNEYQKRGKIPINKLFDLIPLSNRLWFVAAGGGTFRGYQISGTALFFDKEARRVKTPNEADYEPPTENLKLTEYINSPCLFVFGQTINRGEIIRYVVNKLGDIHLVKKREPRKKPQDQKFILLDIFRETIHTKVFEPGMDAVYYELLSAGQRLAESNDIKKLRAQIDKIVNQREG